MSDRIAVMSAGEIQQIGSAHDIYERPANRFVADFIGETNLIDVTVEGADGRLSGRLKNGAAIAAEGEGALGAAAVVSIRPERLTIGPEGSGAFDGVVEHIVYLGTDTQHLVRLDDGSLITVRTQNAHSAASDAAVGDRVSLIPDKGAARLLTT